MGIEGSRLYKWCGKWLRRRTDTGRRVVARSLKHRREREWGETKSGGIEVYLFRPMEKLKRKEGKKVSNKKN